MMEHLWAFLETFQLEELLLWFSQFETPHLVMAASALAAGIAMFAGVGPGIGMGVAAGMAANSAGRAPGEIRSVTLVMLLGQAVAATAGIFSLVIGLLLIYTNPLVEESGSWVILVASTLGAGLAILGAAGQGIGQGFAAGKGVEGVAARPKWHSAIVRAMLLGQAVAQTTGIYALIVALILLFANPFV